MRDDTGYTDVTHLFTAAISSIEPGQGVFMQRFSLHDAMGAIEIGEPRMDSGVLVEERRDFESLTPFTPEEICWIIDRAMAAETLWHSGTTLAQSIYTIHYVHNLLDINPEFLPRLENYAGDETRPLELLTIVLRANMLGLLKCCDFMWRELSRNNVYDGEDWQGEKCDISLLEAIQPEVVLKLLDDAILWLETTTKVDSSWKTALIYRTMLRKCLLQIFSSTPEYLHDVHEYISTARQLVQALHSAPQPQLHASDPRASWAFDPAVYRRLPSYMPLRTLDLPSVEETWAALRGLVDGWFQAERLLDLRPLFDWQMFGLLQTWQPIPHRQTPYLRSVTQSIFSDGNAILLNYPTLYAVEIFFESTGLKYGEVCQVLQAGWSADGSPPLEKIESQITRLVISHIWALGGNQPRLRRKLMNSLFDWHSLYHELLALSTKTIPQTAAESAILKQAADTALFWRLDAAREFVLSGFQLQLYAPDERAFAYWYASKIMDAQIECIERTRASARHLQMYAEFLRPVRDVALACSVISLPLIRLPEVQLKANFRRRYKWTLNPGFSTIATPDPITPPFDDFLAIVEDPSLARTSPSPSQLLAAAHEKLTALATQLSNTNRYLQPPYTSEFCQFIRVLDSACQNLNGALSQAPSRLDWSMSQNAWFPTPLQ